MILVQDCFKKYLMKITIKRKCLKFQKCQQRLHFHFRNYKKTFFFADLCEKWKCESIKFYMFYYEAEKCFSFFPKCHISQDLTTYNVYRVI